MVRRLGIALVLTAMLVVVIAHFTASAGACVRVPYGADLHLAVENGVAEAYCLDAGTFELGNVGLKPDDGDRLTGRPVMFGPNGEVQAQTFIHGTDDDGIIQPVGAFTLKRVDVCCSPDTDPEHSNGRGLNGTARSPQADALTVIESRIHGNGQCGICGVKEGLRVLHSEIDHNGSGTGGYDAGVKTIYYAAFVGNYVHDNQGNGLWWDCDAPGGDALFNRLENNLRDGVFVEISSGDASAWHPTLPLWGTYGFRVKGNTTIGNNTDDDSTKGGIAVTSSINVMVDSNVVTDNHVAEIRVANDSRSGNGHSRCSAGFEAANVNVTNNTYGPGAINGCDLPHVTCVSNPNAQGSDHGR
jgi:hypothetical protein